MKRLLAALLVLVMVISLTACTSKADSDDDAGTAGQSGVQTQDDFGNTQTSAGDSDNVQPSQDNEGDSSGTSASDSTDSSSDTSIPVSSSSDGSSDEASGSESAYEFEKAGLSDSILEYYRNMVESGPGAYFSSFYESYDPVANTLVYICENGDVVARFPDTGDMTVLTTEGGHFMYEFKDSEGCYTVTDFVDNLYEYYFNMSLFVGQVFMTDMEPMRRTLPDEPVYSSYREIVDMSAKKLLDASSPVPEEGGAGSLWLSCYKRFDGKELAGRISEMMGQPFDGSYNGNYSGSFVIYSYTEDENTDEIEDSYTISYIGNTGIQILKNYLSVTYMNLLGVDGGSFCNYAFKKDGLHRIKGIEPYTDTVVVSAK